MSRAGVLLASLVALAATALPALSRDGRLAACPFAVPGALIDLPEPVSTDASDDIDESGDVSDDKAAVEWPGGGIGTDGRNCVFIGGEVSVGYELTHQSGRFARFVGPRTLPGSTSTVIGSFSLGHLTLVNDSPLFTRFSADADADGAFAITEASIAFGPFLAGLSTSMFDAWSGDEFSFRALASSQSPSLFAARVLDWPDTSVILSLEDASFRRVTLGGYGGMAIPDLLIRVTHRHGPVQAILTAARHDTRLAGGGSLTGHAFQASLRYDLASLSPDTYLIAQATHADNALGYLGINTRTNTLGILLPGILDASTAERGHGLSGAVVFVHQIGTDWRLAAFTSASRIVLERDCGGCEVRSTRAAVNLTWMPTPGLEIALEAGAAQTRSSIPLLLPGRRWSTILSLSRSF